jgi:hypothetical protein
VLPLRASVDGRLRPTASRSAAALLPGRAHLERQEAAPSRLLSRTGVAGFIPKTELIAADLKRYFG